MEHTLMTPCTAAELREYLHASGLVALAVVTLRKLARTGTDEERAQAIAILRERGLFEDEV
jgi:hypothetical protein